MTEQTIIDPITGEVRKNVGGAALVRTDPGSTNAYGPYPARDWLENSGTGAADNDILFTALNLDPYSTHIIHATAGTVDVEITIDGTNWTDSATNPVALEDAHATAHGTYVLTIAPGKVGIFRGKVAGLRVRQNGATAASAVMGSY